MYEYHSANNKIQLIGEIVNPPVRHEVEKGPIIRLVLAVDERDDNYKSFYSYHVIIIPADRMTPHIEMNLNKRDRILVQGRLNNYKDKETGNVVCNIHAAEVMVLRRAPEPKPPPEEKTEEQKREEREREEKAREERGRKSDLVIKSILEGKLISLDSRREPEVDEGDELGEVDENGRIDDPFKAWREWKRAWGDSIPF